jgi:hypothetical protein
MAKAAVIIMAGADSHADQGRLVNGLQTAREFANTDGDEVKLIFDGAGTEWIPELEAPESDYEELYQDVREHAAVCDFCAHAFEVNDAVADTDLETLADHDGHPSIRSLVTDEYEIITF